VYAYSQLFNHLAQYAPEQVDINEYHFMNGLSIKLQECLMLNTDGTFLELVSNAIIAMMPFELTKRARTRRL
jgi:hypothetical protein